MNSMSGQKLKGIPYTGTLPAVLTGTKAGYLHRYKVYGNLTQNGTPTPENPIVPSECGERTENIIDGYLEQSYISSSAQGVVSSYNSIDLALFPIEQGVTYTIQRFVTLMELYVGFFISKPTIGSVTYDQTIHAPSPSPAATFTFVAPITGWAAVRSSRNVSPKATVCVVKGSTAPMSYIPYGYKLPLTSGNTPVDIYLGESQTTRQIKKLVLTGEESWSYYSAANAPFRLNLTEEIRVPLSTIVFWGCSHYEAVSNSASWVSYDSCISWSTSDGRGGLRFRDIRYSNLNDFKTYIAQQYVNGTPVTVWYVLATPTTGTLNEPLRKIGNYADTIDSTQTSAQIPTTVGSTTISWGGSGLAPSQFDSIQEWVDIPTYKRVNGEWVEDN